jgi:hypothetical protein
MDVYFNFKTQDTASGFGTDEARCERGAGRADSRVAGPEDLGVRRRCKGRVHHGGWISCGPATRQWTLDVLCYTRDLDAILNRTPSTLQIGVRSGIHDGRKHYI